MRVHRSRLQIPDSVDRQTFYVVYNCPASVNGCMTSSLLWFWSLASLRCRVRRADPRLWRIYSDSTSTLGSNDSTYSVQMIQLNCDALETYA